MKTVIIDGNNLIHKNDLLKKLFLKDKGSAQISLTETVKSRTGKDDKVIFVFDGHGTIKKENVFFSGNFPADKLIRERIERFKDHKKLKVVSSDNDIIDLAKVCGCEVRKSEDFWNELNKSISITSGKNINQNYLYDKKEKPDRMSRKEADEFRKYFT